MCGSKRQQRIWRGTIGKLVVVGADDRSSNRIDSQAVGGTDANTLQLFVGERAVPEATVFTYDHKGYRVLPNHQRARHTAGEYVNSTAHTNGNESFRAALTRGCHGTFHHFLEKHRQTAR